MVEKLKQNKRIVYGIIALLVLMIVVLAFKFFILDEYKGKIAIKNVESYSTVLSADVSQLTGNANVSEGYDTVKYTIKYTLDNPDSILRDVVINAKLSSSESKYTKFKEIKGTNITSKVSEDGIIVNLKDVPTNEEQEIEIELVISNAPYGFKVRPNVTVKEVTSDEKSINMDEIIVSTNSIEGNVIDQNGNTLSSIELALLDGNNEIKRTYTNSEGEYVFGNLDSSKQYNIVVKEDAYKKVRLEDRSTTAEKKVMDVVVKSVDPFNLEINKYITKLDLVINGKKESYTYNDEVKVQRAVKKAKNIEGSIYYKITLKNTGEIDGTVGSIQDIIPEGLSFDSEKNPGWEKKNGKLYYRVLEENTISSYEERVATLVLDIVKTDQAKTYINEVIGKSNEYKNVVFLIDGVLYKDINVLNEEVIDEVKINDENFSGWYTDPNYTNKYNFKNKVTKNMILYGSLMNSKCNVTFIDDGNVLKNETINCGDKVSSISVPGKTGYTFKYWTLNNQQYDFDSKVTTDIALISYYEIETYNITYNLDGGVVEAQNPITYTVESNNITLNNPVKEGYTFNGWTGSNGNNPETIVIIPTGSTGNKEYTANFSINSYTLFIDPNGGLYEGSNNTVQINNNYETTITISNPLRTGYDFTGWTLEGKGTLSGNSYTYGDGNGRLVANYTPKNYTITYELNGGSVSVQNPTSYTIESDSITLNNPSKTGFTFTGWTGTELTNPSTNVTIPTGSTGNREYTANYSIDSYTLTVNPNGGKYNNSVNPTDIPNDFGTVITLDTPTRDGYNFAGWTLTGKGSLVGSTYTYADGNGTVTANWEVITYQITYSGLTDAEEAALTNPTEYNVETSFSLTNPQDRLDNEGDVYERFTGWTYRGITEEHVTIPAGTIGDIEFTANFVPVNPDTYTIYYNYNGGAVSEDNPTSYTKKSNAITLHNPTKEGYNFAGWTGTGLTEATVNVTIPHGSTGDRTYTATYTPIEYSISYDGLTTAEVEALRNPKKYTIESDAITLINPTREGYTFSGWTGTGLTETTVNVTIPAGSTGNKTYTAHFVENGYTIDYNLDGGTVSTPNPISYTVESEAITLNNPTKPGYTFEGWTGTGLTEATKNVTIPTGSTGNREYTATYALIEYSISYDGITPAEIETLGNPTKYTVETDTFNLSNPTRTGYRFTGWTGSNGNNPSDVTITKGTTGDKSYTAHFEKINFNISYVLNGGTASPENPTSYTIESDTITLNNPTKDGYTFLGWTGTDYPGLTTAVTIPTGSIGDRSFEAHFSADEYTITYHLEGGSLAPGISNPETYTIESNAITLNNPTKEGYTFTGWTGSNGTNPQLVITINHGSTGNKEYTANYDINSYTVTYKNGENTHATDVVEYNQKTTAPMSNPVRSHAAFSHWSLTQDGEAFDFDTLIVQDTTLYAVFDSIEAPTITHTPTSWTNDKVTVNITSSHNDYEYYYKINDGEYTKYTADFDIDYNCTVYAYSTYGNGTSEEASHAITNIDKIAPSIESEETPYIHTVDLDMSFLDNESGVKSYKIYLSNNLLFESNDYTEDLNEEKNEVYTLTSLEASTSYTYRIELTDVAGNTNELEKTVTTEDAIFVARVIGMGGLIYDDPTQYVLFESLQEAIDYCSTTQCTIQIIPNELEESVTVTQGQEITLDLDGKILYSSELKTIENNGSLTIVDNSEDLLSQSKILNTNLNGTAIVNNELLIVGKDDGIVSITNPLIQGVNVGIDNEDTLKFYDGKAKGEISVNGEVNVTPYSYNATIKGEDSVEIMILQIVEEPEARINSKYYTKLANAVSESKIGTDDTDTTKYLSQIVEVGDYGFIYNSIEDSIISQNIGLNSTTALSMLELDLTEYTDNQFMNISYSISAQSSRDYGYITILDHEDKPAYNQATGRVVLITGVANNYTKLIELEAGKKHYIYFGYYKNESYSLFDDYFKINSLTLSGKGSTNFDNMVSDVNTNANTYVRVDNYNVLNDLSGNAKTLLLNDISKRNVTYNSSKKSLDYNSATLSIHFNNSGLSFTDEQTVDVEYSTTLTGNQMLYKGNYNEKVVIYFYNGVLVVSNGSTRYNSFELPSNYNDGEKHRFVVSYNRNDDNGNIYHVYFDGNELNKNESIIYEDCNSNTFIGSGYTGSIYNSTVYGKALTPNDIDNNLGNNDIALKYDLSDNSCVTNISESIYMPNSNIDTTTHSYMVFDLRDVTESIPLSIDLESYVYDNSYIRVFVTETADQPSWNSPTKVFEYGSGLYGYETVRTIQLQPGKINYVHFDFWRQGNLTQSYVIIKKVFIGTPEEENKVYEKEKIDDSNYYFKRNNVIVVKDLSGNNNDFTDSVRFNEATKSLDFANNSIQINSGITITNEQTVDFEFSTTNTANKIFYMGSETEKIAVGVYNSNLYVSNNNQSKPLFALPSDIYNGSKHRLTVTYKKDESNAIAYKVYYDGTELSETGYTDRFSGTNQYTYIGDRAANNAPYYGSIYNVKVYDKVYTPTEIDNDTENENLKLYYNLSDSRNVITDNHSYISNNYHIDSSNAHSALKYDLTNSSKDVYISLNYTISSEASDDIGYITVTDTPTDPGKDYSLGRYAYVSGQNSGDILIKLTKGKINYLHLGYYKDRNSSHYSDSFVINEIRYVDEEADAYTINPSSITSDSQVIKIPRLNQNVDRIELLKDITLDYVMEIPEEKEVILDLNGHILKTSKTDYVINNKGSLTIDDSDYSNSKQEINDTYAEDLLEYNELINTTKEVFGSTNTRIFSYNGDEQEFIAPIEGDYVLEVWGAQGGDAASNAGGFGGYSTGTVHLNEGEKIYINVGGQGNSVSSDGQVTVNGNGYNGGGRASYQDDNSSYYFGSGGGGATSISTESGTIDQVSSSSLLIIAGGGGASASSVEGSYDYEGTSGTGGNAGGYIGNDGTQTGSRGVGTGGTQLAGGTGGYQYKDYEAGYGLGCSPLSTDYHGTGYIHIAGGGGYYGGGCGVHGGGGGGSSYIASSRLSDKHMACYDCAESNDPDTKTVSTDDFDSAPTSDYAKVGNGYAKITLLNANGTIDISEAAAEAYVNDVLGVTRPVLSYDSLTHTGEITSDTYSAVLNNDRASLTVKDSIISINKNGAFAAIDNQGYLTFSGESIVNTYGTSNYGIRNQTVGKIMPSSKFSININNSSTVGLLNNSSVTQTIGDIDISLLGNSTGIYDIGFANKTYNNIKVTGTGTAINVGSNYPTVINYLTANTSYVGLYFNERSTVDEQYSVQTTLNNSTINSSNTCISTPSGSNPYLVVNNSTLTQNNGDYRAIWNYSGKMVINNSTISTSGAIVRNRAILEINKTNMTSTRLGIWNGWATNTRKAKITIDDSTVNMTNGKSDDAVILNYYISDMFINDTSINVNSPMLYGIYNYTDSSVTITGESTIEGNVTHGILNLGILNLGESNKKYTSVYNFDYTGSVQEFTVPKSGNYKIETWGASGGAYVNEWYEPGKGAYTSGDIYLEAGTKLYVYVGEKGLDVIDPYSNRGAYNGGTPQSEGGGGGGGATDISISGEEVHEIVSSLDPSTIGGKQYVRSLESYLDRIMVAGGAGGAGESAAYRSNCLNGLGLSLVGNSQCTNITATTGSQTTGGFGYSEPIRRYWVGKGAGYFVNTELYISLGGTSYISGYEGSVAMRLNAGSLTPISVDGQLCADGTTDVRCSYHPSGYIFTNTVMKAGYEKMPTYDGSGYMVGNYGNGHAKITLLDEYEVESVNTEYPKITGTTRAIYTGGTSIDNEFNFNSGSLIGPAEFVLDEQIDRMPENYELYSEKTASSEKLYLVSTSSTDEDKYEAAIVDNDSNIVSKYTTVKAAVEAANTGLESTTKIILLKDIKTDYDIVIPNNKNITIDYRGHYLKSYNKDYAYTNNGILKLMNSVAYGSYENNYNVAYGKGYINNNGTMDVDDLYMFTHYNTDKYIVNSGTLNLNDLTYKISIYGLPQLENTSIYNTGVLNIDGGNYRVEANNWQHTPRIVDNFGTANIKNISIYTTESTNQNGNDFYHFVNEENATMVFDNISAEMNRNGYRRFILNNIGTAEIKNSTIVSHAMLNTGDLTFTNNTFGSTDETVVNNNETSSLTINGGTYATTITNSDDSSLLVKDGTITKTITSNSTGSITIEAGTVEVNADKAIISNTSSSINLGIKGDGTTSISNPKIKGNKYGIFISSDDSTINFYDGIVIGKTAIQGGINEVENGYSIQLDIEDSLEKKYLVNDPIVKNLTTNAEYLSLGEAFTNASNGDTLQLLRNVVVAKNEASINNSKNITLDLNDCILDISNDNFIVNTGSLTIKNSKYDTENSSYNSSVQAAYNSLLNNSLTYKTYDYYYTGSEQAFIASYTGTYKISAWGAQGGNAGEHIGGYGAYSSGEIFLNKGDVLYINVGGKGLETQVGWYDANGGYNGGGYAGRNDFSSRGSGGGATSIATKHGLLSSLSDSISDIVMVSAGGGGAAEYYYSSSNYNYGNGGAGGGIEGNDGTYTVLTTGYGHGGTQNAGGAGYAQAGSFGQGGASGSSQGGGGGAGLYGGGSAWRGAGSGGGSSYIGNSNLTSKAMYCFDCTESSEPSTKTISVSSHSEVPTVNTPKEGHGFARITLISTSDTTSINHSINDARAYVEMETNKTETIPTKGIVITQNPSPIVTNNGTLTINSGIYGDIEFNKYSTLFRNNGTMTVNNGSFNKYHGIVPITQRIQGSTIENNGTLTVNFGRFTNADKSKTKSEYTTSSAQNTFVYNKENATATITGGMFDSYSLNGSVAKGRMFYNNGTINISNISSNYSSLGYNYGILNLSDVNMSDLTSIFAYYTEGNDGNCQNWKSGCTGEFFRGVFYNEGTTNIDSGTFITGSQFITNIGELNINPTGDKNTYIYRKTRYNFNYNDDELDRQLFRLRTNSETNISNLIFDAIEGTYMIYCNSSNELNITNSKIIALSTQEGIYIDDTATITIDNSDIIANNNIAIDNRVASDITIKNNSNIISKTGVAINNTAAGTVTFGEKGNGVVSKTNPMIQGSTYGLYTSNTNLVLNFYDGITKGKSKAIEATVTDMESGYTIKDDTEVIDSETYKTKYPDQVEVVQNTRTLEKYFDLYSAFDNIQDGDTLKMIDNYTTLVTDNTITVDDTVTLDLNGYEINQSIEYLFINNGTLNIIDNSSNKTGFIYAVSGTSIIDNFGTINLTGAKLDTYGVAKAIINESTGTLVIDDNATVMSLGEVTLIDNSGAALIENSYIANDMSTDVNAQYGMIHNNQGATMKIKNTTLASKNAKFRCSIYGEYHNESIKNYGTLELDNIQIDQNAYPTALIYNGATGTATFKNSNITTGMSLGLNGGQLTIDNVDLHIISSNCYDAYPTMWNNATGTLIITDSVFNVEGLVRFYTYGSFDVDGLEVNAYSTTASGMLFRLMGATNNINDLTMKSDLVTNYSNITIENAANITNSDIEVSPYETAVIYNRSTSATTTISDTNIKSLSTTLPVFYLYGSSTVTVLDGTYTSLNTVAYIYSSTATFNLGTNNSVYVGSEPYLKGETYGVYNNDGTFNYYDGVLYGVTNGHFGPVTAVEDGYRIRTTTEDGYKESYLSLVGTTEAVAESNGISFDSLQTAINYAVRNNTYVSLVIDVTLTSDLTASAPVDVYLNGYTLTPGIYTIDNNINVITGSYNPSGSVSRILGNILGIDNKDSMIIIYETDDGKVLDPSVDYRLYLDGKLQKVDEEEAGKYNLGSSDEILKPIKGRIYLGNVKAGTYKLVGSDNKEISFIISEDGKITGNVKEYKVKEKTMTTNAKAELILSIQTGIRRVNYMLIAISLILVLSIMFVVNKRRENS